MGKDDPYIYAFFVGGLLISVTFNTKSCIGATKDTQLHRRTYPTSPCGRVRIESMTTTPHTSTESRVIYTTAWPPHPRSVGDLLAIHTTLYASALRRVSKAIRYIHILYSNDINIPQQCAPSGTRVPRIGIGRSSAYAALYFGKVHGGSGDAVTRAHSHSRFRTNARVYLLN